MAHTKEEQEKFIELRARGLSFEKIATEIGVSKTTLIKWQVEFSTVISNLEYYELQQLLELHKLHRRANLEDTATLLESVNKAVKDRDLNKESLKDLLSLKRELIESLEKQKEACSLHTGIFEDVRIDPESEWSMTRKEEKVLSLD